MKSCACAVLDLNHDAFQCVFYYVNIRQAPRPCQPAPETLYTIKPQLFAKEALMKTILVPVDGSDSAVRAVKAAIKEAGAAGQADIHLITVHPPIVSGNVKRFFSADAIKDYYEDEGRNALMSAKAVLDEA